MRSETIICFKKLLFLKEEIRFKSGNWRWQGKRHCVEIISLTPPPVCAKFFAWAGKEYSNLIKAMDIFKSLVFKMPWVVCIILGPLRNICVSMNYNSSNQCVPHSTLNKTFGLLPQPARCDPRFFFVVLILASTRIYTLRSTPFLEKKIQFQKTTWNTEKAWYRHQT